MSGEDDRKGNSSSGNNEGVADSARDLLVHEVVEKLALALGLEHPIAAIVILTSQLDRDTPPVELPEEGRTITVQEIVIEGTPIIDVHDLPDAVIDVHDLPDASVDGAIYLGEVDDPGFVDGSTYLGEVDDPGFVDGSTYVGEVDDPGFVDGENPGSSAGGSDDEYPDPSGDSEGSNDPSDPH